MYFSIHIEDQSGKRLLEHLVPKLIDQSVDQFEIHPYRGIGRIPKGMKSGGEARHRILLDQLPRILRGLGRTFAGYPSDYPAVAVIVIDLDRRCFKEVRKEMLEVLQACEPAPHTQFCIAIEEGEAWLLGDHEALRAAYPQNDASKLSRYEQDSICDTWEHLADVIEQGGAAGLKAKGWQKVGEAKSRWAASIGPHMNPDRNRSPSFQHFRDTMRSLSGACI